jgi:prephenate dehydrogenase
MTPQDASGPPASSPPPSSRPPHTVGLLGFGHFGRALSDLVREAGLNLLAFDPINEPPAPWAANSQAQLATRCDLIIPAVPIAAFHDVLADLRPHLTPNHLILDVASVKRPSVQAMTSLLGTDIPWVATHPLFGPASIARGETPLRAVVCPNPIFPAASMRARVFYERVGCVVTEQNADDHDRLMADTHAMAFFIAKAMLAMKTESGARSVAGNEAGQHTAQGEMPTPPSFAAMATTIETVRADAGHLFYAIQSTNPFAADARERLIDALSLIHRELADDRYASDPEHALEIPAPKATPPELIETRDLIDELDRELVELLARRATLSRRARHAKAQHGKGVHDPAREKSLLKARQQWGLERNLSAASIADVFEAILRFSRAEQRRPAN